MPEVVDTAEAASRLATWLQDPDRSQAAIGVSVDPQRHRQVVDIDALERAVGSAASVHLVTTAAASWELKRRLPERLDVYGDAMRLWRPGLGSGSSPQDHPLTLIDDNSAWHDVVAWITTELEAEPTDPTHRARMATPGDEHAAIVTEVSDAGAEVWLEGDQAAYLPAAEIAGFDASAHRLVRTAQTLRVRVTGYDHDGQCLVSSLPFRPDPLERLAAQCPVGSTVQGQVVALHNFGARVALLPTVEGILHVSELTSGWARHPEDHLSIGQLVAVRIIAREDSTRILLSRLDIDIDVIRPSLLPDGPSWFPADAVDNRADQPLLATELPPGRDFGDLPSRGREAKPDDHPSPAEQARQLETAIADAHAARETYQALSAEAEQRLAGLRTEATRLVRDLERDLVEARRRVIATVERESNAVLGSTESELDRARAEIARLRAELATVEQDRQSLGTRLQVATSRAENAERTAKTHRDESSRRANVVTELQQQLDRYAPEGARIVDAIRASWVRLTTHADRERYPWHEPLIGPDFIESLHEVQGVGLERIYDVCAEVACGRAVERRGLHVHQLRATDESGSPQRVRDDGARAFRASLQVHSAAARRLHYWALPDGTVELAKIGYHDDFTI